MTLGKMRAKGVALDRREDMIRDPAGKWFSMVLLVILCTMLSAGAWG